MVSGCLQRTSAFTGLPSSKSTYHASASIFDMASATKYSSALSQFWRLCVLTNVR
jgi:hypothetical protein